MKRIFFMTIFIFMMLIMVACGDEKKTSAEKKNIGSDNKKDKSEAYDTSVFDGIEVTDVEEFDYSNRDGVVTVNRLENYSTDTYPEKVSIPAEIESCPVTTIMTAAFSSADKLKVVVVPEGVTEIMGQAFYMCDELTAVSFPSTLTTIGSDMFAGSNNVTEIYIPASVTTIYRDPFYGSKITKIYVEEGSYAQQWCIDNNYDSKMIVQ